MNDRLAEPSSDSQIILPAVQMNVYTPKEPGVGRVVKSELCVASPHKSAGVVRHIEFDVGGSALAGAGRPGQAFGVLPPGVDANGKAHKVRLYSYASPSFGEDGGGHVISTCVKRVIDEDWKTHKLFEGVASNYLCDLQVGEEVKLTGPVGRRFLLPISARNFSYIFVATGTGIAPFRAMVMELLRSNATNPIVLIMGVAYATDLLYHPYFQELADRHPNFHYLTAVSREMQLDGKGGPMYVHQRIVSHTDLLLPLLQRDNTLIYICGITGMEVGLFQQFAEHLTPHDLSRYLTVDGEAMHHVESWTRPMIHREIRTTDRVFLEVYG
ncbi:MAG: hypothetical protein WD768_05800 [Phycisphaeraceae bacterium]